MFETGIAFDNARPNGFLHRDLRPAILTLTAEGHPNILDFGTEGLLARAERILTHVAPALNWE